MWSKQNPLYGIDDSEHDGGFYDSRYFYSNHDQVSRGFFHTAAGKNTYCKPSGGCNDKACENSPSTSCHRIKTSPSAEVFITPSDSLISKTTCATPNYSNAYYDDVYE